VQVIDSLNATASQQFTITINPQVAIATPLPASLLANIGGNFSLPLQTSAGTGIAPFTWAVANGSTLPSWLILSSGGVLSATQVPTTANTAQFTVKVTDSANVTASLQLTVTVAVKIVSTTLPSAEQTQAAYTATLAAQGGSGTYSWTVASGTLPAGLNLAANGSISGSPQAGATTQTFTVQASDTANPANTSTSQPLTLSINSKVAIAEPSPASLALTLGSSFNLTLQTSPGTGVAPFTWSLANGSTLPPWLSLSAAGVLSAAQVPANANSAQFTVQVTDSANVTASLTLSVTVPFKIVTTSLPSGEPTQASYSASLTAQGGSGVYSWTVTAGSLPAGLNLAANGSISGSPAAGATTQTFTVQVTDSLNATASQQFTITVNPQVAIAPPSLQDLLANIGSGFSLPLQTAAGTGVGPFTWSVANGSTLPSWLNLSSSGVLSAAQVPTTANTAQFTVQVTDSANVTASLQLTVTVAIKIVTASLPIGEQTQTAYNSSLGAQGGSGGYTWTVTSGTLPAGLNLAANGSISGSPAANATTQTFTVKVLDSANASTSQQFTITISPQLAIDAPLPASLAASIGSNFNLALQPTQGTGIGPFTWALANGSTLPSWLSLSSGGILSATQVPTNANTAQFTVQVTDSVNVVASLPLTVTVAGAFNVSGNVTLINGGGPPVGLAGVVVTLANSGSTTNLTVNTVADGSFTVPNVPNGTYTATLQFPPAPSSAFLPASANITNTNGTLRINVNNSDLTGVNFNAALGFTVSGKLSYGGRNQDLNPAFISLQPVNCNNCPVPGTSAQTPHPPATPGGPFPTSPFVINGVPPGTYTLRAWSDHYAYGVPNAIDPVGTAAAPVTVSLATGNVTGAAVTMNDPTTTPNLVSSPLTKAYPIESGAIIQYQPIVFNGVEQAAVYTLQWASTSITDCEAGTEGGYMIIDPNTGDGNPLAAGGGRTVILDSNNPGSPALISPLVDRQSYYFCMQGWRVNPGVGSLTPSSWSVVNPPVTIGPPTGSSGTNTVSGNVIIPDGPQPNGPLYAGGYDTKTGKIYSDVNQGPLVTASQGGNPYSVSGVPTGTSCFMFAMIDQDMNGLITPSNPKQSGPQSGDIYNTNTQNPATITIGGNTVQDIDLTPFVNNNASTVATEHVRATDASSNTQETYNLKLLVAPLFGLPSQVTLLSGPNVIAPADFAICSNCGAQSEFNISLNTNGVRPQVDDTYTLEITYSDVTIPADFVMLKVTGVSDAFATSLVANGSAPGGTTTPTFSWVDPPNAGNYGYQFLLSDSNAKPIWQIPGANAFFDIFPSSITQVPWSTTKDPTNASNPPSVTTLTVGATYTWSIAVQDTDGNSAKTQVTFVP